MMLTIVNECNIMFKIEKMHFGVIFLINLYCSYTSQILLPRSETEVNSTYLDLGNYSTLVINVTTPNISLVLKLDPSEEINLHLLLGFEHYPNITHHMAAIQLPQPGNSAGYIVDELITPILVHMVDVNNVCEWMLFCVVQKRGTRGYWTPEIWS